MDRYLIQTVARYTAGGVGLVAVGAVALHEPTVRPLAIGGLQVITLTATAAGCTILVGYAWHRLELWERSRPPALASTLPQTLAFDVDAVQLAHEAREPGAPDPAGTWQRGIMEFAFVSRWGGFGWRSMCRYLSRDDWKRCLRVMVGARVLTEPRGNLAAEWAPGWSYSRFRLSLKHYRLQLPYPADAPPPIVEWRK